MHEGWSVLISGTARQADADETEALGATVSADPWAGGDRTVFILITPVRVTGRRISAWRDAAATRKVSDHDHQHRCRVRRFTGQ
jgi:hypothetical protein